MSALGNRSRVLNALAPGTVRGYDSVESKRGMTVGELAALLGLAAPEVRLALRELWTRGQVRATADDRLERGRDPEAPCGFAGRDARPCILRYRHDGAHKPE